MLEQNCKPIQINFDGVTCSKLGEHRIDLKTIECQMPQLRPVIITVKEIASKANQRGQYDNGYGFVNLCEDTKMREKVAKVVCDKRKLEIEHIVVIGIGGSNLGPMAVHHAIYGRFGPEKPKVWYADAVDADYIGDVQEAITNALEKGEKVLLVVMSKSGTTAETIANFASFREILKVYHPNDYNDYIVAITNECSKLWNLAGDKNIARLPIPKEVGGRYSVFSPVGLFPLGMMGVNIDKLLSGARDMRERCLATDENGVPSTENPAALCAVVKYLQLTEKAKPIHVEFIFSWNLQTLGAWYRQLIGESLGREKDLDEKIVHTGITPVIATHVDLHSQVELYLGGPNDKYTSFLQVEKQRCIDIPAQKLIDSLRNKNYKKVLDASLRGTLEAYLANQRPYSLTVLSDRSEFSIGSWLQLKLFEVVYLASLLNVCPFGQQKVEEYKVATKRILG